MRLKRSDLAIIIENFLMKESLYDVYTNAGLSFPSKAERKEIARYLKLSDAESYSGTSQQNIALEKAIEDAGGPKAVKEKMSTPSGEKYKSNMSDEEFKNWVDSDNKKQPEAKPSTKSSGLPDDRKMFEEMGKLSDNHSAILVQFEQIFLGPLLKEEPDIREAAIEIENLIKRIGSKEGTDLRVNSPLKKAITMSGKKRHFLGNSNYHSNWNPRGGIPVAHGGLFIKPGTQEFNYTSQSGISKYKYLPNQFKAQNKELRDVYVALSSAFESTDKLAVIKQAAQNLANIQIRQLDADINSLKSRKGILKGRSAKVIAAYEEYKTLLKQFLEDTVNAIDSYVQSLTINYSKINSLEKSAIDDAKIFLARIGYTRKP